MARRGAAIVQSAKAQARRGLQAFRAMRMWSARNRLENSKAAWESLSACSAARPWEPRFWRRLSTSHEQKNDIAAPSWNDPKAGSE